MDEILLGRDWASEMPKCDDSDGDRREDKRNGDGKSFRWSEKLELVCCESVGLGWFEKNAFLERPWISRIFVALLSAKRFCRRDYG
ncbi:hypothetical protein SLE2022_246880 [Rubroshorea leprosula]